MPSGEITQRRRSKSSLANSEESMQADGSLILKRVGGTFSNSGDRDDLLRMGDREALPLFPAEGEQLQQRRASLGSGPSHSSLSNHQPHSKQPLIPEPVDKWRTWWIRATSGSIMISLLAIILMSGVSAIILMVVALQTLVFKEVISIAHQRSKEKKLPWFRTTIW